jgi:4-hydroxybenzoate polyprenyltransferase
VILVETARTWGRMVRLSHSVFALPFALSGAALAAARTGGIGAARVAWIVVAMFAARNAAMGFNRLADHELDALNPRTAGRELPRGALSRRAVVVATALLSLLFVIAAFRLGPLCGWLSPLALAIVFGYSYAKRFTWASHAILGLALAIAPVGGWLAVAGDLSPVAWVLGAAVLQWVAGFDVIYACQDVEFDRRHALRSIPARFGIARALRLSAAMHALAVGLLLALPVVLPLGPWYLAGALGTGALLWYEHTLVRPDDLSRVNRAFFTVNGWVGFLILAATATDLALRT